MMAGGAGFAASSRSNTGSPRPPLRIRPSKRTASGSGPTTLWHQPGTVPRDRSGIEAPTATIPLDEKRGERFASVSFDNDNLSVRPGMLFAHTASVRLDRRGDGQAEQRRHCGNANPARVAGHHPVPYDVAGKITPESSAGREKEDSLGVTLVSRFWCWTVRLLAAIICRQS